MNKKNLIRQENEFRIALNAACANANVTSHPRLKAAIADMPDLYAGVYAALDRGSLGSSFKRYSRVPHCLRHAAPAGAAIEGIRAFLAWVDAEQDSLRGQLLDTTARHALKIDIVSGVAALAPYLRRHYVTDARIVCDAAAWMSAPELQTLLKELAAAHLAPAKGHEYLSLARHGPDQLESAVRTLSAWHGTDTWLLPAHGAGSLVHALCRENSPLPLQRFLQITLQGAKQVSADHGSPLHLCCVQGRTDHAAALLSTGAFTAEDVSEAVQGVPPNETTQLLEAYRRARAAHAALAANMVTEVAPL